MKAHTLYRAALVLALMVGVGAQAQPAQVPTQELPLHIKMCLAQMQTAQQMFMYRAAELTRDQVHSSINMAMQLLRWKVKQGVEAPRNLDELETTYRAMADEIYDMSPENFMSTSHQQEWSSNRMNACIEKLQPIMGETTASEDDQNLNMIPAPAGKPNE